MAFHGWTDEAVAFFEGLEADNSKAFWTAHKPVYEAEVLAPMNALLDDLAAEFGRGRLFRPYRDTRFSKDKSPYKTTIAASIPGGRYVQLSATGLGAGAGAFHLEGPALERYREAVDDERTGGALASTVAALERSGASLIGHDLLKTAPRGYARDHPRIDLLRRKGIAVWREIDPGDWLGSGRAAGRIAAFYREAQPLGDWLAEHVTPPE